MSVRSAISGLIDAIRSMAGKFISKTKTVFRNGKAAVVTTYEWVRDTSGPVAAALSPVLAPVGRGLGWAGRKTGNAIGRSIEKRADRKAVTEQRKHEVKLVKSGRSWGLSFGGRGGYSRPATPERPGPQTPAPTQPAQPQMSEEERYADRVRGAAKRLARDLTPDWSGIRAEHREFLESLDARQLGAFGGVTRAKMLGHLDGSRPMHGIPLVGQAAADRQVEAATVEDRHPRMTGTAMSDRLAAHRAARLERQAQSEAPLSRRGQTASLAAELHERI